MFVTGLLLEKFLTTCAFMQPLNVPVEDNCLDGLVYSCTSSEVMPRILLTMTVHMGGFSSSVTLSTNIEL